MSCCRIDSIDDSRLAAYRQLKRSNLTRWSGQFVAEGDKLVRRLLASGHEIVSLLVTAKYLGEFEPLVARHVPIYCVDDTQVEAIVGFNFHRGILACGRRRPPQALDALIPAPGRRALCVICPNIHDPENLGSVLRTSLALGIDAVILGSQSADPYSRRVLRTSMGATFDLPIAKASRMEETLAELRARHGVELLAAVTAADAVPLEQIRPAPRTGIVLGGEGHGLSPALVDLCDRRVTIPMSGKADSLNLAIAAGVMLYHASPLKGANSQ